MLMVIIAIMNDNKNIIKKAALIDEAAGSTI